MRLLLISVLAVTMIGLMVPSAFAIKTITDDATGGDCASFGTWEQSTKTCTFSSDLQEPVESLTGTGSGGLWIASDGITIDGNNFTLTGIKNANGGGGGAGIMIYGWSNVTVKNLTINGLFSDCMVVGESWFTDRTKITENTTIENNSFSCDVRSVFIDSNPVNTIIRQNTFSEFDEPSENCYDSNADGFCDEPFGLDLTPRCLICESKEPMIISSITLSNQGGQWYARIIGSNADPSTILTFEIIDSNNNTIDSHNYQSNSDGSFDTVWSIPDDLSNGTYTVKLQEVSEQFIWESDIQLTPIIHPSSPCDDGCTHEGNNPDLKIFASGYVENPVDGVSTISSVWKDPAGVVVYDETLQVNAQGQFNNEFDNPMYVRDMRDSGLYTATYTYDGIVSEYTWNYLTSVYVPQPDDGPFTLPCSMQEKGDGVSTSSCNGFYESSVARAEVGINYHTGILPIENYKAVGFFIDEDGNQGDSITVTLGLINPDESKTLLFNNTQSGFVSEFQMQMLGGTLVEEPEVIPATFELSFDLDGVHVLDVIEDYDFNSLIFNLETISSDAQISVTISRTNFDSSGDITVLVDGNEYSFSETKNSSTRTLTINLPTGTEEIEIIGSKLEGKVSNNFPIYSTIYPEPEVEEPETDYPMNVTVENAEGSSVPGCEPNCFVPSTVYVNPGGQVTFANNDSAAHTSTSGTSADGPNGIWDSSLVMTGQSYTTPALSEGTYSYFCMVHPWMNGTVIVGEGGEGIIPDRVDVKTERGLYRIDDTVVVYGSVYPTDSSRVDIQIRNPNGSVVFSDTVSTSNGSFRTGVELDDDEFEAFGSYRVTASFGTATDDTRFQLIPTTPVQEQEEGEFDDSVTVYFGFGSSTPGCDEDNSCYLPHTARVNNMGMVTWKNEDAAAHTTTSGTPGDGPTGFWDSSLIMSGQSYSHKFERSGYYDYFCMVHPWRTGVIIVGEDTAIPTRQPVYSGNVDLDISIGERVYDINTLVDLEIELSGNSNAQNVAISVTDPRGVTKISRSVSVEPDSQKTIQFRIDENFKPGVYKISATTNDGNRTVKDMATFKIKSQFNSFKITSVEATNQKGDPAQLVPGEIGFIKVTTNSNKSIATLITVNLFDSEITSIGIGSVQSTLSSGESEIILSFMIPEDTALGPAEIFVNAFSDWPSDGGIPLTKEFAIIEDVS